MFGTIGETINFIINNLHQKNLNNGERIETYVIEGTEVPYEASHGLVHADPPSWPICLNGAAARKFTVGDKIIILSYKLIDILHTGIAVSNGASYKSEDDPKLIFPNERNEIC